MRKNIIIAATTIVVLIAIVITAWLLVDRKENKTPEIDQPQLVSYFLPENEIYASPNGKGKVTIAAKEGSIVSVKLGFQEFKGEKIDDLYDGNNLYVVHVTFPGTKNEIDAIGRVKIICKTPEEASTVEGPKVVFEQLQTTTATTTTEKVVIDNVIKQPSTELNDVSPDNIVVDNDVQEYFGIVDKKEIIPDQVYQKPVMVEIVADRADVWPGDTSDDIFNPSYSALAKGTMAYASCTSSAYDSSKKDTRYFFNLTYGARIPQNTAKIVDASYTENNISASSSVGQTGTVIKLKETWHVPYRLTFTPQKFYASGSKLYNTSEFNAESISFTFYHTDSVTGNCDVNGSEIVSNAQWSGDSANKTVTLTMNLKKPGGFYGFSASYDANGDLVITLRNKAKAISGSVFVLDAGHGGIDGGASGLSGQIKESDINFAETVALKNELESRGAKVYLTRYDDDKMTLDQRIKVMYKYNPDFFISLHSNSATTTSAIGPSVYYYKPMSYPLANSIYASMLASYKQDIYASDASKQSQVARGCNYNPFGLTRVEECPSVLIELGFVSNDEECINLCNPDIRAKLAVAIANGIQDYMNR